MTGFDTDVASETSSSSSELQTDMDTTSSIHSSQSSNASEGSGDDDLVDHLALEQSQIESLTVNRTPSADEIIGFPTVDVEIDSIRLSTAALSDIQDYVMLSRSGVCILASL